jgi:peptidoglycan hydrolase-like protein with peptidoglycan-binding domain
MIDAMTAVATTGNFTSAMCTINAQPAQASRSGEPIALTITSTNTFAALEFNGEKIQSGYTTTVYPTEVTTYSALLNGGFGCKYTVEIQAPNTANLCTRTADVVMSASGESVNDIQQFLIDQNYPIIKTGTFDVRTQTALKLFQMEKVATVGENMLSVVSGVWDARTRAVVFGIYMCGGAADNRRQTAVLADNRLPTTGGTQNQAPTDKVCFDKFIRPSVTNGDVVAIQSFLNTQAVTTNPLETTGYYGAGTKAAVKTFQEKFAADILKPNDLTSGNGIWGPSTAKKASALGLCGFVK